MAAIGEKRSNHCDIYIYRLLGVLLEVEGGTRVVSAAARSERGSRDQEAVVTCPNAWTWQLPSVAEPVCG